MTEHKVNKWDEVLAQEAQAAAAAAPATASEFFSVKGSNLYYKGQPVPNNRVEVVVADFLGENQYYRGTYNPAAYEAPVCYAFGNDPKTMAPHPDAAEPQSSSCATCPHNQWGSNGKGKACKNILWLGMLPVEATKSADAVMESEVAKLKISPTNTKHWGAYVSQVTGVFKRPPFAVITEVSVKPHIKNQYEIVFKTKEIIEDKEGSGDVIGALIDKRKAMNLVFTHTSSANNPTAPSAASQPPQPASSSRFGRKLS